MLAKLETFNPGNSIKDRMAVKMIEDAEREGLLKPGGTIVEGTSGNTGMGLAIAAVIKGYRCVFTTTDKQSKEKIDALKAFGAEVIVCPTDVDPEDPRSYYSVSSRLAKPRFPGRGRPISTTTCRTRRRTTSRRRPRSGSRRRARSRTSWWASAPAARSAASAGISRSGTRRSRCGASIPTARCSRSTRRPASSTRTRSIPYITEGIGEDFLPSNVDFAIIDHFEKVTDKDAALMTRRLAREEGIWVGNSAGSAMAGLLQLKDHFRAGDMVVVVFHDHGSRYMAKMFNDEWMRSKGFFEVMGMTARDLVAMGGAGELFAVEAARPVEEAAKLMSTHDFSQVSVTKDGRLIGSLNEAHLYEELVGDPDIRKRSGGGHHAAGVSVRGHLNAGGAAGDDDQPGEAGRARPRLQDREDLHHHALRHHPSADVNRLCLTSHRFRSPSSSASCCLR